MKTVHEKTHGLFLNRSDSIGRSKTWGSDLRLLNAINLLRGTTGARESLS